MMDYWGVGFDWLWLNIKYKVRVGTVLYGLNSAWQNGCKTEPIHKWKGQAQHNPIQHSKFIIQNQLKLIQQLCYFFPFQDQVA